MIQNVQQLESAAAQWLSHVNQDLSNQLNAFMQKAHANVNQLAQILAISADELNSILRGNADVKCSTLAKLLIATDNVLEVKPLSATPMANQTRGGRRSAAPRMPQGPARDAHGRFIPRGAQMPPPPYGAPMGGGYPSPEEMHQMHRFGGMPGVQSRIPHGAPIQQEPMAQQVMPTSEYDEMSRQQLVNLIAQRGFTEQDINTLTATRGELIDFLVSTDRPTPQPNGNVEAMAPVDAAPMPMEGAEEAEEPQAQPSRAAQLAQELAATLEGNPQLCEVLGRFLHPQH